MLKKISIIVSFVFLASVMAVGYASAQTDTVNCFDYYKFGSVQVPVTSEITSTVSGTVMSFTGSIKNDNQYPVVGGKVVVKIFRKQAQMNANGPYVVDQFTAKENINIAASSSQKIDFTWKVPAYAKSGDYQVATFFTSADKFNLLGLTFTDDVIGNRFDFKVVGEQQKLVEFDKNSVKINSEPYYFAAFSPTVETTADGVVSADLLNETNESQTVKVTWKTYWWDAQDKQNLLSTKTEMWTLSKGEKKNLSYKVTDKTHSVYLVMAEVEYKDTKSIMGVRFSRNGIDIPRINFPAITSFPLTKGTPTTLFSCLHNTNNGSVKDGSLTLKLEDKDGNVFREYKYDGTITSAMMAVKDDFTPSKNYDNFSIVAELSQGGKVVDSAKMTYNCKDIDPSKCFPVSNTNTLIVVFMAIILIFLIAILYFAIKKREHKVVVGVGLLMVLTIGGLYLMLNNHESFAETPVYDSVGGGSVVWHYIEQGYLMANPSGDAGTKKNNWNMANKLYEVLLPGMQFGISYNVVSSKPSGSTVYPGETIRFTFKSQSSQDISWSGTGGKFDTPYGSWVADAGVVSQANACNISNLIPNPSSNDGAGECSDGVNHLNGIKCAGHAGKSLYGNLNIAPPTKALTNTSGLTCGAMTSGGYVDCTVSPATATTTINPTFSFGATTGKFYAQWAYGVQADMPQEYLECDVNSMPLYTSPSSAESQSPLPSTFVLNVPTQTIPYTFNVSPSSMCEGNTAPTGLSVTISDPVIVNQPATITMSATDSQAGDITYQIDWGNGVITNVTGSTFTKIWTTTGAISIKVRAVDRCGAGTEWITKNITVSSVVDDGSFTVSCSVISPSTTPIATGTPVTFQASSVHVGDSGVTYNWPDGSSGTNYIWGGSSVEGVFTPFSVTGTDNNTETDSLATCSVQIGGLNDDGDGLTSAPCELDGITIPHGASRYFYSSRIAATCVKELVACKNGNLGTNSSIFRFRSCVQPDASEF